MGCIPNCHVHTFHLSRGDTMKLAIGITCIIVGVVLAQGETGWPTLTQWFGLLVFFVGYHTLFAKEVRKP